MWGKADKATKTRLEKLYEQKKEAAQKEKDEYEARYGKI
jgi:hypothetical protein